MVPQTLVIKNGNGKFLIYIYIYNIYYIIYNIYIILYIVYIYILYIISIDASPYELYNKL